jgi:hypothetical protein
MELIGKKIATDIGRCVMWRNGRFHLSGVEGKGIQKLYPIKAPREKSE